MKIASIEDHQAVLLEILCEIDRIAVRHNVPYFLAYGTLLGAVRQQRFIPWDGDADISIFWTDQARFVRLLKAELPDHLQVYDMWTPHYDHLFPRVAPKGLDQNLMHVDIFPLVGSPRSSLAKDAASVLARFLSRAFLVKRTDASYRYEHSRRKRWIARGVRLAVALIPAGVIRRTYLWLGGAFPYGVSQSCFNIGGLNAAEFHIPLRFVEGTVRGTLSGREFNLPARYHDYLTQAYGQNYLQPVPPATQAKELAVFEQVFLPKLLKQQDGISHN